MLARTSAAAKPRLGDIDNAKPDALAAAPAIQREMAGEMRALATRGEDRVPERAPERAEGKRFQRAAIVTPEAEAQVPAADFGDLLQALAGDGDDRLGIAGPIRPGFFEQVYGFGGRAGGG